MSDRRYGTLEYERANAIKLVEDIESAEGLMQGGEQYPNALSVADAAGMLRKVLGREPGLPEEERASLLALAEGLDRAYHRGVDIEGVNGEPGGIPYAELKGLADEAMMAGVPAWTP